LTFSRGKYEAHFVNSVNFRAIYDEQFFCFVLKQILLLSNKKSETEKRAYSI